MYNIFNMGIGMVIAVNPAREIEVLELLNETKTNAYTIGELIPRESQSLILKGDKLCE